MSTTGRDHASFTGHRAVPLGRSPFGHLLPAIGVALAYALLAGTWVARGPGLPGGRWLAVHLFTLGVVTNLVLAFTDHFARTVTRTPTGGARWQLAAVNAGILLVLLGMTTATAWSIAAGVTVVVAVVVVSYLRLRQMRRNAVGARFLWIVRSYERAHGAFVHGALLGLLLGIGVLPGSWHAAGRLAHLHVNVLGWGGLTLLATLVFFGPTIMRTRIVPGADERAAHALRHGATGLALGVLLLLASGLGGTGGVLMRLGAAAGMAGFAWSATVTCLPVARAALSAKPSPTRWPVAALSVWFPVAAWGDVAIIATGAFRFLDSVGVALLLGVLAQTIAAVLTYLTPMLRGRDFASRDRLLARFERGSALRPCAYNAGVLLLLTATATGEGGPALPLAGWALVVAPLLALLAVAVAPLGRVEADAPAVSQVARRYRSESAPLRGQGPDE